MTPHALEPGRSPRPLEGVRVLDIASLYAAPLAATLLADFGAEVIKVEPPGGDGFRGTTMWPVVARNKKSITLDLRQTHGCELLKELVAHADVLVENYPAAVLAKREIGWKELSARNSDLVMVSVSCFGQTGPYAERPGSGTIGEGFGGLVHMLGAADGPPLLPSFPLGDALGAMNAAIGTMMALYWRDAGQSRTARGTARGRGQQVDASLYEPVLFAISQVMARWKPGAAPQRSGSRLATSAIRNIYATRDARFVAISASTERHVVDLVKLAGGTEEAANLQDADPTVAGWVARHDQASVVAQLVAARIPIAPVNDVEKLLHDPHIAARKSILRVDDDELGPLALVQPSPKLSQTPGAIHTLGAPLSHHNQEVFGGLLGMSRTRMKELQEQKII